MSSKNRWYRHPILRSLTMAILSVALFGTWAWFANASHSSSAAWKAAATQGFVSFTLTFTGTALIEFVLRKLKQNWLGVIQAAVIAMTPSASYTIGSHWIMGTKNLWITVAPSLLIGTVYSLAYAANLARELSEQ